MQDVVRGAAAPPPPADLPVALPLLPEPAPAPALLAWGRWAAAPAGPSDFSLTRLEARQGRVVTVGDNDFLLYRAQDSAAATLAPGLGQVSFALQQAHAQFTTPSLAVQPASVQGGSLAINFSSRQFSTALSLSSAATGNVTLQAAGALRDDGLFTSRSASQGLAGATALNGQSAGYLFEKAAAGGTLSGITLWSR